MIIPISIENDEVVIKEEITQVRFKDVGIKEGVLEEFIRKNIDSVFGDEETLLIIGQQVVNAEKGRSDLVALDKYGSIVLIEIKRDMDDIVARKEAFEFQAIRYAASLGTIKTVEELVEKVFGSYISRYRNEFPKSELNDYEYGEKIVNEFLQSNNSALVFNIKQRIILIASDFDEQTLSAVSWLIKNKVDISCFAMQPQKIGSGLIMNIEKILPIGELDDFFVEIVKGRIKRITKDGNGRVYKPRMSKLFEWGLLKKDDKLVIRNREGSEAIVMDQNRVKFKSDEMSYNDWGQKVTGWSSIDIYEWAIKKDVNKSLDELRMEKYNEEQ